ncbi:MAG: alpha/beta hydrolase, partial [Synechococcales bacterium]|nr:alpha/beta hydrolase [Synechococcales bacterium]
MAPNVLPHRRAIAPSFLHYFCGSLWQKSWRMLTLGLVSGVGLVLGEGAIAAERVTTFVDAVEVSIPVEDIETFAREGTLSEPLTLVASQFDDQQIQLLRQVLRQRVNLNSQTL